MALYQQGNQKIEIIIKTQSGGAGNGAQGNKTKSPSDNGGKGATKTWRTAVFGSENPQRIRRVLWTNATHLMAITKQVADLGIEFHVGGLGYANGDSALQSQTTRQIEILKDSTNIISSVAMGAVYGSWGGPIGAALGAAFAAVSTGTSLWSKYANREREYSMKLFKQENAIEYKRARAQLNLTTGRLR